MDVVAVTCVVARGPVDALEALLPSLPGRSRPAGSVAVNAVWVEGHDAWRPSAYAEGSPGRWVRAALGPVLFPTTR